MPDLGRILRCDSAREFTGEAGLPGRTRNLGPQQRGYHSQLQVIARLGRGDLV